MISTKTLGHRVRDVVKGLTRSRLPNLLGTQKEAGSKPASSHLRLFVVLGLSPAPDASRVTLVQSAPQPALHQMEHIHATDS
jgi:hypothetical protein